MSPKILRSTHAEDVGSAVVEPGDQIPDDADADVVKRLRDEGKIEDSDEPDEGSSAKGE
jgi:hypothetical protein